MGSAISIRKQLLDNKFLVDLDIGVDEEWILQRVGIRERRTVLDLEYIRKTRNGDVRAAHEASRYSNAQSGRIAAEMALSRARLKASDIGMVVGGGSSQQNMVPAEACSIAAELSIEGPCFDVIAMRHRRHSVVSAQQADDNRRAGRHSSGKPGKQHATDRL